MIPAMNIIAWGHVAPWAEQRQIEQDLIISRALVELFSDDFLRGQLRFRGGTALNKLLFPAPLRYSEDIDLVRTTHGGIGPILDRIREVLDPWFGHAAFDQSPVAPKLNFRADAEDGGPPLRLKVEINTREEMLATKLRALLQRDQGRDLLDLSHALGVFEKLDTARVATIFARYLAAQDLVISRAQAEERMFAKLANPGFLADIRPLVAPDEADRLSDEAMKSVFAAVLSSFIAHIPGHQWARTAEMSERYGVVL
ncbi:MAG: nucleotidyl transferase AbiEii/AbiGii toxin family protein [Nitrococcus sp.]|nr:nucleotidyl transferase AbiEii/AbiGii toxin family protein [Nitrococcus sp.]